MQSITEYNYANRMDPPDTAMMNEVKSDILDFTRVLLERTKLLQTKSKELQHSLDGFDNDTYDNWASLNARLEDIKRRLNKDEREHLETAIKGPQPVSLRRRWEYNNSREAPEAIDSEKYSSDSDISRRGHCC